ncbi:hypothetical protein BGW36DRAFT_368072 [Talaromyces proteolyticus]|uniref:NF-kappa-B inhibitor-like protein 1 n=1 Tax=Talaromyces proteolyticus TaxID=1131652 RepID=A0AAD4L4C6_9EURO|nr:uncharacterized protein BGW36DRAFT_368072 [Talaromyces proteolyticus]KAH8705727.1 hypothetical protein BGW36DRAFT_368072 [Talaromyces proteolyticus]
MEATSPSPTPVPSEKHQTGDNPKPSRSSKFRFKSSKRYSSRDTDDSTNHRHRHRDRHHRSHHYHHRHRRNHASEQPKPSSPSPSSNHHRSISPETAFRESLFDAMADDEGALYWESVYGQPIHTYSVPSVPGPNGELEQMSEEEYATYVRRRMWEKSHEGMMEERERQRKEREKERHRHHAAETAQQRQGFEKAMEESLRRGERRRRVKVWKGVWERYMRSWEELNNAAASAAGKEEGGEGVRRHIHWPVESGKQRDVRRDAVREFVLNAPFAADGKGDILSVIKSERVRWHPDKMMQRYGGLRLGEDKAVVKSVTEVFQILDDLWTEERGRQ